MIKTSQATRQTATPLQSNEVKPHEKITLVKVNEIVSKDDKVAVISNKNF